MKKNKIHNFLNNESFVTSKKMGQNFLHSTIIKKRIVDSAQLNLDDLVLEIGPGLGSITDIILDRNHKLLAIELDKRLYSYLDNKYSNNRNFKIINNDVLKIDLDKILKEYLIENNNQNVVLIANLPYSISSKIILKILKSKIIRKSIIMVQKEMALRICAKPNSHDYNAFSALIRLTLSVSHLFNVSPSNFVPPPKVDSSVIKLEKLNQIDVNKLENVDKFLRICFHNRRKTLLNNLEQLFERSYIIEKLNLMGINTNIRAQQLSPLQLYNIFNEFYER